MIKKTISYELFDGEKVSEDFYFNLTKTEILQWRFSVNGGIETLIKNVINKRDESAMVTLVVDLIDRSYGEKSIDGKSFIKVKNGVKLVEDFKQTAAYDALFMELCTDADKATEFIKGIIPPELAVELSKTEALPGGAAAVLNASTT